MRRIFEPFFTTKTETGTGLGYVGGDRNWVERHEGDITGVEQTGRAGQRDGVHRVSSLPGSAEANGENSERDRTAVSAVS